MNCSKLLKKYKIQAIRYLFFFQIQRVLILDPTGAGGGVVIGKVQPLGQGVVEGVGGHFKISVEAVVFTRRRHGAKAIIGGVEAQVLFAGLSPGFSGLYQVNARVPANAPLGNEVEITVEVSGQASRPVTIAIR